MTRTKLGQFCELTLHTRAPKNVRDNLVVSKSPKLLLSDNKETSVTILRIILSKWNFRQLTWRIASKTPVHWVADKAENETETHIDLPNDVPDFLDTTIVVKLATKTTLTILAVPRRFVSQNKVMPSATVHKDTTNLPQIVKPGSEAPPKSPNTRWLKT